VPKVTEEHLRARKQHIVDAAFLCFARKGFHQSTMQDICKEAGLSAGAVYRYLASKEEIIQSAFDACGADVELLDGAVATPDTREMLPGLVRALFSWLDGTDAEVVNRAMLQLWAEMAVNERVRGSFAARRQTTREGLSGMVREAQRRGDFSDKLDTNAIVSAMFALFDGFRLQKATDPS
jgi:AcrR family transcriptional regulator